MKKGLLITSALLLVGCAEPELTYNEKKMPISEVEERMEDLLESENPYYDLEISITEDTE